MALYRCALCGSSKVILETKQEGYNTKKGLLGAALFGGIGALAGTSGNKVTYYHCGACGQVLNHTMVSIVKNDIDDSISGYASFPNVYESSLKRYKQKYFNIEWEEPTSTSVNNIVQDSDIEELTSDPVRTKMQVPDIEDCIIKYMKEIGVPVRSNELDKELGLDEIEYSFKIMTATQNLQKKGILKSEKVGGDWYWVLITDIAEMKELALAEQAREKAENLAYTKDYVSIIKKYLSYDFMTYEEIYECLKQNDHLEKDVVQAEEENLLFPKYFINACMARWGLDKKYLQYVHENDKYRMKTTEELSATEQEHEIEQQKQLREEANALMPIVTILQNAKQPLTVSEILDDLETMGATQYDYGHTGRRWTNQALSSKLKRLEQVGMVTYIEKGKRKYYSIVNIQQEEINERLIEAVSK